MAMKVGKIRTALRNISITLQNTKSCLKMAASRFPLFGSAALFLRSRKAFILKPPRFSSKHQQFYRYSPSTALDAVSGDNSETLSSHHPWPEWVTFVDHLKIKGYFTEAAPMKAGDSDADKSVYQDIKFLKDPCLSFARDRYDIFKLLSMQDVRAVVVAGCPNLNRKTVNSAKRLRAYVQLDEGDVCSACSLRGSCDKAYVIVKESEGAARTVDIVRILLFYALDPFVFSQEKSPGRELFEESARKLISELIVSSEISPGPTPKIASAEASRQKGTAIDIVDDELPPNVEMKRGDWICPKCNFLNFSRNVHCRQCKEDGPKKVVGGDNIEMKKGDWICRECSFMNFARNTSCKMCTTEGPRRFSADEVEMKKGDWNCPKCYFMNFAHNKRCLKCQESRPKRQLEPGEWECPLCDFFNYRRNIVCIKCNCERPKETRTDHGEHARQTPNNRSK